MSVRAFLPLLSICAAAGVLAAGCANPPTPRTEYLLRGAFVESDGTTRATPAASIGTIQVASYLERPGLQVEIAPGELRAANGHVWAEPLEDGLRQLLRAELARALDADVRAQGPAPVVVDLRVDRLHGTVDGRALLEATYRLSGPAAASGHYRFAASLALPREGYAGLVEAERALVRRLAGAIAAAIRTVGPADAAPPAAD